MNSVTSCLLLPLVGTVKMSLICEQQGLSDKTHQDLLGFEILKPRWMACVSSSSILRELKAQDASTVITKHADTYSTKAVLHNPFTH